MNEKQLAGIPVDETMLDAIHLARKLPRKEGRRRQLQFIGKLMREGNHEEIQAAVDKLQNRSDQHIHRQHQVERYRDMLIEGNKEIFQTIVSGCPGIDVQHLRHLIRSAQKELEDNKPPASARKLFTFIREQLELQDYLKPTKLSPHRVELAALAQKTHTILFLCQLLQARPLKI